MVCRTYLETPEHRRLDADSAKTMLNLLDALEDNDDVQKVSSNVEIDNAVMAELAAEGGRGWRHG